MLFHLYKINDQTMQLALQIETIKKHYLKYQRELEQTSNQGDTEELSGENNMDQKLLDENEDVMFSQIPRKITLFRCVMEKKLGLDWEHSE